MSADYEGIDHSLRFRPSREHVPPQNVFTANQRMRVFRPSVLSVTHKSKLCEYLRKNDSDRRRKHIEMFFLETNIIFLIIFIPTLDFGPLYTTYMNVYVYVRLKIRGLYVKVPVTEQVGR